MVDLSKEAIELCNTISTTINRLEREQRENGYRGVDHTAYIHRLERIWQRAADRWRRRIRATPIYR